ncbi:MAG: Ig-like domain-containing protein [Epsilonproteobacteria bacterium]|nr:Ig-like domain-containing protein [Campylobacterota bacterium]
MALTSIQLTDIVKATVVMFSAAPGGYMQELKNSFIANGSDMTKFMTALSESSIFTNQYPNNMSNTEKAAKMAGAYGLTDITTEGTAGKQAYDYFLNGLTANKNMGAMFAEANAFIATTTDAAFTTTKTLLANKTAVAEHYTVGLGSTSKDYAVLESAISGVTSTTDVSSNAAMEASIIISATQTSDIVKATVVMFSAAPGGYMQELKNSFIANGSDMTKFMTALSESSIFTNQYPNNMSNTEKAAKMAGAYGLTDITTEGTAGKQAYDYFLNGLTANKNMGAMFAEANAFIATTTDAAFTTTKTLLANKTAVAEHYTVGLGSTSKDYAVLESAISGVTSTTDVSTNTALDAAIAVGFPPILSLKTPLDNATDVGVGSNIVLTFNETIALGTGDIVLKKSSDNSIVETFNVATGAGNLGGTVSASGMEVTVNPNADLSVNTEYYVTVVATAVKDTIGKFFMGISSAMDFNFTTVNPIASTPIPEGGIFTLTASAPIVTEIMVSGATTKAMTFALTLSSSPTVAVTINYATQTSGTATSGADFTAATGTVTFAVGQTVAHVSIVVNGDATAEADETVAVLFSGTNLSSNVLGTGTILANDTVGNTVVLTAGVDTPVLGDNDDTINTNAPGQLTSVDTVAGGLGTDTLSITPTSDVAFTLDDAIFTNVSGIEKITILTTGTGSQTITTGAEFNGAFGTAGADLQTTSTTGAQTINMSAVTGPATLTSISDASTGGGGNFITMGAGITTVKAVSSTGAQTINSAASAHATVTVTTTTGAVTVTTGGGDDIVTLTTGDVIGTANSITTGAGADTITATAGTATTLGTTITGGTGADTIILTGNTSKDKIVIGNTDSGITVATADSITGFTMADDTLSMGTVATGANYVEATVAVAGFAAALTAANVAMTAGVGVLMYSFQFDATNGYLFVDNDLNGTADQVVLLVGITDLTIAAANVIA